MRLPNSIRLSLAAVALCALLAGSAPVVAYPVVDLNKDNAVNMQDLGIFVEYWLDAGCSSPECEADLDGLPGVDGADSP